MEYKNLFYGYCGPFRENFVFWQEAVLAIFQQKNAISGQKIL